MAPWRITAFLASAPGHRPGLTAATVALGAGLAARGWGLVYGGAGVGLMAALADAALAGGGEVIGVIPHDMVARELAHPGLTSLEVVSSMAERKHRMFDLADGFVTLPGGFGTLDELFEALTAAQLGQHHKPIVVVDVDGYYRPLITFLDHAVEAGLLRPEYRALVQVVADERPHAMVRALAVVVLPFFDATGGQLHSVALGQERALPRAFEPSARARRGGRRRDARGRAGAGCRVGSRGRFLASREQRQQHE